MNYQSSCWAILHKRTFFTFLSVVLEHIFHFYCGCLLDSFFHIPIFLSICELFTFSPNSSPLLQHSKIYLSPTFFYVSSLHLHSLSKPDALFSMFMELLPESFHCSWHQFPQIGSMKEQNFDAGLGAHCLFWKKCPLLQEMRLQVVIEGRQICRNTFGKAQVTEPGVSRGFKHITLGGDLIAVFWPYLHSFFFFQPA